MSYIGNQPINGAFQKLDSIAGSFNGVAVTFNTLVATVPVQAGNTVNLLIVLNGVLQEPSVDYTVTGSTITFTTAPATGTTFFGMRLGHVGTLNTVTAGTVGMAALDAGLTASINSIAGKQATLVSGTNIKTVNSTSLLGSGDVAVAGLAGNTFTGAQIYSDQVLSRGMTKDMGSVFLDKGNSGTAAQTLDYTAGSHQKLTVTGAFTLSTSNWPPTGNTGELLLELVNGASSVITWPTVNWVKSDGTFTTTFASNGVTLQSSGTDFCLLWSRDGGTTVYGKWMR